MRHPKLVAAAGSLLLAGAASQGGFNGLEPTFMVHDPYFRVACDNHMTVRPTEEEYWQRMKEVKLPFSEAAAAAEQVLLKGDTYDSVKMYRGELILLGQPYYNMEVYAHGTDPETAEPMVHRWHIRIGMRGKAKSMVRKERLPGTMVRGPIVELPSGAWIHDSIEGDGQEVREDSIVRCHYMLLTLDGRSPLASTYADREPFIFDMQSPPIEGFKALIGARVGGKRKLVIPPDLAFGAEGKPPLIGPYTTLVYDVEIKNVR